MSSLLRNSTLETVFRPFPRNSHSRLKVSECAKGAGKASCGETVVQRNVFLESPFLLCSLKVFRTFKGADKKRTLQKHPFGQPFLCTTTPSPLLWLTPKVSPLTSRIPHTKKCTKLIFFSGSLRARLLRKKWKTHLIFLSQDKFDHDEGQRSAISGRCLHWRLSTGFLLFLQYL